ncbi:MAG: 3-hydroxyacyl-CoA dehydrogenase NAD-binding domain-containing protein [Acidobacteriota bacterium]
MTEPTIKNVAVVGTGVIGRSWIQVFARAGCRTRVYDRDPAQVEKAMAWLEADLEGCRAAGLNSVGEVTRRRSLITVHKDLNQALEGVGYVQESAPEPIDIKRAVYAELDRAAGATVILGSSTSALDMTEIAEGLTGADRCLVAHPVNPPHVIPVVEVLPGKQTDSGVVERACEFLTSVGQTPVLMNSYVPGFLLNRMQAALVREAIHLVESGVADVNAVDAVIRDGLGLRWALMGPFGVANTNADGGVREYFTRYGRSYIEMMNDLGPTPSFSPQQIARLGQGTDAMIGGVPHSDLLRWRDRLVMKICELKKQNSPAKNNS